MSLAEAGYLDDRLIDREGPLIPEQETRNFPPYLERIKRPDLKDKITAKNPLTYWTMEIYRDDVKGNGGLGMLASDTVEVARKLNIPMVAVSLFYTEEKSHKIEDFEQTEVRKKVSPEKRGFSKAGKTEIHSGGYENIPLDIWVKQEGSTALVLISEPNIGELYQGENNGNHRLYQEVALGFGGRKALEMLGINSSQSPQLDNESPTVFAALANLDKRIEDIRSENPDVQAHAVFAKALIENKEKTTYINHTLVDAAEARFTTEQFEYFVLPNIKSGELKTWLRGKIMGKGGKIKLSTLAIELSGKKNGVSLIQAKEASKVYKDYDEKIVDFEGITNGISLDRWGDRSLLNVYRLAEVVDEFDLPASDYNGKLDSVNENELKQLKRQAKERLVNYLEQERVDQYGNPIKIPLESKIFNWRRRIAGYKRPDLIFSDPNNLAEILENEDIHLIMSGNVHPNDEGMKKQLKGLFNLVDKNEILKKRVHFVQDYDEGLGRKLVQGADVSINTPVVLNDKGERVSTEACGTSWMKDVLNNTILISTDDGGVADISVKAEEKGEGDKYDLPYLQIKGKNRREEVYSLYGQILRASALCDEVDPEYSWADFVKIQTKAYLPIISGSRMESDYLNLIFPINKN